MDVIDGQQSGDDVIAIKINQTAPTNEKHFGDRTILRHKIFRSEQTRRCLPVASETFFNVFGAKNLARFSRQL
jgi:hypothetical protein